MKNDKEETIWDNTNIAESYPGVTLPLTFSFISHAYSQVYLEFLLSIGVSKKKIGESQSIFSNLLGHLQGHVYYNAKNWYSLVRLLPGYRYNRDFFEAMWNPKKKMRRRQPEQLSFRRKIAFLALLLQFAWKLVTARYLIKKFVKDFFIHYDSFTAVDIKRLSTKKLAFHYRQIERKLFAAWAVPILNDFRVMIFHGIFRKLVFTVIGREDDHLVGKLLTQHLEMSSLDLVRELQLIATGIQNNPAAAALFKSGLSDSVLYKKLDESLNPSLVMVRTQVGDYIRRFGDRNPSELKLESPSLRERPEIMIAFLKQYLTSDSVPRQKHSGISCQREMAFLKQRFKGRYGLLYYPLWVFLRYALKTAKESITAREEMRLLRSLAYGLARRVFIQFGTLLNQSNLLHSATDIFFMSREEILGWAERKSSIFGVAEMIKERQKVFKVYKNSPTPPGRVKTYGSDTSLLIPDEDSENLQKEGLRGIPASAGTVRGTVVCMKEFNSDQDLRGKILVTRQTDPGWTIVFPLLSGLVTERGNILSHAAIVSRELRIPSVLAVEKATDILKSGDYIELNGSQGTVTILK